MRRIKITELRKTLFRVADDVADRKEQVVLTRRGKKDLVLVSLDDWLCVKEKAAKYENQTKKAKKKSMVGSLILKTRDLEADIRKIRDDFARALDKASIDAR